MGVQKYECPLYKESVSRADSSMNNEKYFKSVELLLQHECIRR